MKPMNDNQHTQVDWSKTDKYRLDCRDMCEPINISHFFRNRKIKNYVYQISFQNIPIKYGMSAKDKSKTPGNRVYTQLGSLDSWGVCKISRGLPTKIFRSLAEEFQKKYGKVLNHNDISIYIWSFDNYDFIFKDHTIEIKRAESTLITTHAMLYGEMPIGNKRDEMASYKPSVSVAVYDKFFEVYEC
jgi:hypothetical protein